MTNARRFDLTELLLIAVLAVLGGLVLGSSRDQTIPYAYADDVTLQQVETLRRMYGDSRFSSHFEEWIARDYFKDRRDGVFVDIGAGHYRSRSNTYFLESRLGWSGIAVDPQPSFAADYARYRPHTKFYALFVSDKSDEQMGFYLDKPGSLYASSTREFAERVSPRLIEASARTITLDDLLSTSGISRIDYLSIDVELAEPKVLSAFNVERFLPALVCIEAHPEVRQFILDYFYRHHYVLVGKYLRVDTSNLYFRPA